MENKGLKRRLVSPERLSAYRSALANDFHDKLAKRGKKKLLNQLVAMQMIDYIKNHVSEWDKYRLRDDFPRLERQFRRMYFCSTCVTCSAPDKDGNTYMTSRYCRLRMCSVCAGINAASKVNRYGKHLEALKKEGRLYFVTLTLKNCYSGQLRERVREMKKYISLCCERVKHQWLRGKLPHPLASIFKLEISYNKEKDTYHPHIHCLVIDKEYAENLRTHWLGYCKGEAVPEAQDVRLADKNCIRELFKYMTKTILFAGEVNLSMERRKSIMNIFSVLAADKSSWQSGKVYFKAAPPENTKNVDLSVWDYLKSPEKMKRLEDERFSSQEEKKKVDRDAYLQNLTSLVRAGVLNIEDGSFINAPPENHIEDDLANPLIVSRPAGKELNDLSLVEDCMEEELEDGEIKMFKQGDLRAQCLFVKGYMDRAYVWSRSRRGYVGLFTDRFVEAKRLSEAKDGDEEMEIDIKEEDINYIYNTAYVPLPPSSKKKWSLTNCAYYDGKVIKEYIFDYDKNPYVNYVQTFGTLAEAREMYRMSHDL